MATGQLLVAERKALASLLRSGKYKDLGGEWNQYHLTFDRLHTQSELWVPHKETFHVRGSRITGLSRNEYKTRLDYGTRGDITDQQICFRYENRTRNEPVVDIHVNGMTRDELLVGIWMGCDFDGLLAAGLIVYSQSELSARRLATLKKNYPFNVISAGPNAA